MARIRLTLEDDDGHEINDDKECLVVKSSS